ncbi:MAG TPA: response regulator [Ktedonobacteraceae bacterium]|nr:response regulator [Ktedonobacteraceae bacterium]
MAEQSRILVVEGEENLNWNIVNSLQKDGYIVRGVTGGAEAIRLLWSEEFDLVICSQQMPDADGFDLLQWMRTYCPNTRMVMLAAQGSMARTQALEMGVASFLEKPLDLHALKEELRRLLHATGFSASLDSFDLLDVIQIITMSRKSIALVVSTGLEEQGVLRFQNGELIWAEYGTLRGEEAFFALAAHKNGTVVHRPWNEQLSPNVTQPLSRLIFQALQYRSKYADPQQLSSELEVLRPVTATLLPSLPPTTLPAALDDVEVDDRPFQFVAEDVPVERASSGTALEQLTRGVSSLSSPLEQLGGVMGVVKNTEQGIGSGSPGKEWWEPTGAFPSLSQPAHVPTTTREEPGVPVNGAHESPPVVQKPVASYNSTLPSWLTDQPTSRELPVMRGNTGQIPAATRSQTPITPPVLASVSPAIQADQTLPATSGAVWPAPSESGLRKTRPEEALYTGRQPAVRPVVGPSRPASAEWQPPEQALQQGLSGPLEAVKPEVLQSLASLKQAGSAPGVAAQTRGVTGHRIEAVPVKSPREAEERDWTRPMAKIAREAATGSKPLTAITPGQALKRNYPALAAALQTLGYSVPGFVASAVVRFDGTPVAQVAIDELDIAPLCAHFSQILQGTMHVLEQRQWEPYEHTVITSRTQHILLRAIGNKKDVFQILITTHETQPAESLEVMANVEAAIAAALR